MNDDLRKPEDWLVDPEFVGISILDPDGWDRSNYQISWNEKISREEFRNRMFQSTCLFTPGFFKR